MNKTIKVMTLGFVIGLSALTGCSSKSDVPASDSAAPTTQTPTGSPRGKVHVNKRNAVELRMTPSIRSSMVDAYLMKMMERYPNESTRKVNGPNSAHVGKVKGAYYAVADISLTDHPMTAQDGPHVWHSPNGTDWEYVGETGGDVCGKVPNALVKVWGMPCN